MVSEFIIRECRELGTKIPTNHVSIRLFLAVHSPNHLLPVWDDYKSQTQTKVMQVLRKARGKGRSNKSCKGAAGLEHL